MKQSDNTPRREGFEPVGVSLASVMAKLAREFEPQPMQRPEPKK